MACRCNRLPSSGCSRLTAFVREPVTVIVWPPRRLNRKQWARSPWLLNRWRRLARPVTRFGGPRFLFRRNYGQREPPAQYPIGAEPQVNRSGKKRGHTPLALDQQDTAFNHHRILCVGQRQTFRAHPQMKQPLATSGIIAGGDGHTQH